MSAFLVVVIIVAALGIGLATTRFFRPKAAVNRLGHGAMTHPEDQPVSEQPSEDARDEPLPKLPLRGKP